MTIFHDLHTYSNIMKADTQVGTFLPSFSLISVCPMPKYGMSSIIRSYNLVFLTIKCSAHNQYFGGVSGIFLTKS